MMMHHNTMFGNKMFGGLEDIIWINMDILTLYCDFDLECNSPKHSYSMSSMSLAIMYCQTKFSSKRISISENIVETVIFSPYEPLL